MSKQEISQETKQETQMQCELVNDESNKGNKGKQTEQAINTEQAIKEVNGLGLDCPEPLMLLRKCVKDSQAGDLIKLYSDDPVSLRDVPAFCEFMGHELISMPDEEHPHCFLIRKGNQE